MGSGPCHDKQDCGDLEVSVRHKGDNWDLVIMCVALLLGLYLVGCAAREPSSTDRHPSIPQPSCGLVKRANQIYKVCCEDSHCVYTD